MLKFILYIVQAFLYGGAFALLIMFAHFFYPTQREIFNKTHTDKSVYSVITVVGYICLLGFVLGTLFNLPPF